MWPKKSNFTLPELHFFLLHLNPASFSASNNLPRWTTCSFQLPDTASISSKYTLSCEIGTTHQHSVHQSLKDWWGIRQPKRHTPEPKLAERAHETRLISILYNYFHLVKPLQQIHLWHHFSFSHHLNHFFKPWYV